MKDCPKCNMTVNAHCECPVCKNNITDVSYSERRWERYAFNRYLLPYLIKQKWFPIVCVIIFLLRIIAKINIENWYFFVVSLICTIFCFLCWFFENGMSEIGSWKYSEAYTERQIKLAKYLCGAFGVISAFLW